MIEIREAQMKDVETVKQLINESFKEQLKFGIKVCQEDRGLIEKDLKYNRVFLAYLDNKPVGTIRCGLYKNKENKCPIGWIKRLGVVPQYRSLGIGGLLLGAAEAYMYKSEIRYVGLVTADVISYLDGFYEKRGYKLKVRKKYKGYSFGLKFWEKIYFKFDKSYLK